LAEYIVEDATPIGDIYCDIRDFCGYVWEWATTPFLEGVIKMGAELEKIRRGPRIRGRWRPSLRARWRR